MTIYDDLEGFGIDKPRLQAAMNSNENWGRMLYAFEYVTVLGVVLARWPETDPTRTLFADWVSAEASVISEHSNSIVASTRHLIVNAMQRAEQVGLAWGVDLVPDHVWEVASNFEEPRWTPTSELVKGGE